MELDFEYQFVSRLSETLVSLLTFTMGGGWSSGYWRVDAVTDDGARFELKRVGSEADAARTIDAYRAQIRESGVGDWARSKGFGDLASHLESM